MILTTGYRTTHSGFGFDFIAGWFYMRSVSIRLQVVFGFLKRSRDTAAIFL